MFANTVTKEIKHETTCFYTHYSKDVNWELIEWEKKKFSALTRHYTTTLGDLNDPDAITVFMGDNKGGIIKEGDVHFQVHNGAEIVIQMVEGTMYWWSGPKGAMGSGKDAGDFGPREEISWPVKPEEGVIFPAGTAHTANPYERIPEDCSMFVLFSPARGSLFPMPEDPEDSYMIEFTEHSFGDKGKIKYFDYGAWRCTYFNLKDGFLPQEPKALARHDFDSYVFNVRGQFEFWFDPDNEIEKVTTYPWEGICIPSGLSHYGRQLGDWMGVVLTRHDDKTARRLEPEDWEKIING